MYALLIALIAVVYGMVKMKETFILKLGNPMKDQEIVALERQKPGYRVFALTPDTCPAGFDLDAGLCYPACAPGYNGKGPVCWADTVNIGIGKPVGLEPCNPGWTNDGLVCREPLRWDSCKSKFFGLCVGGLRGGRLQGRLNGGGICDHPEDRTVLPSWLRSGPGKKSIALFPDRVDGLCYAQCPKDKPNRVPGMPYLCMKGDKLSYGRGVGKVPPIFAFGDG